MSAPQPSPGDPHPDLPAPRRRSTARHGHGPVYDIRRASGLPLRARVARQTERDELAHRLRQIDQELEALGRARLELLDQLAGLRDVLYPPIPWCHGRRPPDLDVAPLPPAPEGSSPLTGRPLRAACLELLRRFGPLPLRRLHGLLHQHGYVIGSPRPVPALSDALRLEVRAGRARRVSRGVYQATPTQGARSSGRSGCPGPPLPALVPLPPPTRPTPLDPSLDEDPLTWLPPPIPP